MNNLRTGVHFIFQLIFNLSAQIKHLAFNKFNCLLLRSVKQRNDEIVVRRVTGPVGCTDAAGSRGGNIIPGIIGGIMPGI